MLRAWMSYRLEQNIKEKFNNKTNKKILYLIKLVYDRRTLHFNEKIVNKWHCTFRDI